MTTSTMAAKKEAFRSLKALLAVAFWLAVWQLAAWLVDLKVEGRGNELLLPYPVSVLRSLSRLWLTEDFWLTVFRSLLRILSGLSAGILGGAVLAVCTSASELLDSILRPAIRVIRATPVTSFILLILLWTGRDHVPVIIAALMVLPIVWENLAHGIRSTDKQLLEMAGAYRFSRIKTVFLIYIPTIRPYFAAAVTTAMGLAWKSGVAAEVLCLPKFAVGTQIYHAKLYLEVPDLFAWTLTVVILSVLLEKILAKAVNESRGGKRE